MIEDTLKKLEHVVDKELEKIVSKGDITPAELEIASKAVCLVEKIKMIDEIDSGYDGDYSRGYRSYDRGYDNSYNHGDRYMSYTRDRDYNYSMDRGYSGHSVKDRMIAHLESTMMDEAQSESEKRVIESMIKQLSGN